MRRRRRQKTVWSRSHQARQPGLGLRAIKAATHQVHPRRLRRRRFFRRLDMNMGQDPLTLQLLQIINGVFFAWAEHGVDRRWNLLNQ